MAVLLQRALRRTGVLTDLERVAVLAVLAFALGAAANALHPAGLPLWPGPGAAAGIPARVWPKLTFADAAVLNGDPAPAGAVFVDVREPQSYQAGHPPGAVNLPYRRFDSYFADFRTRVPLQRELYVYCYGHGCNTSLRVANRLVQAGYENVTSVRGGFEAWQEQQRNHEEGG